MRKRVMALIAILPIVFILALFSVGRAAGVLVDIPVSGISIITQNDDGFIELDYARYNNDLHITAQVQPVNAKNKNYTYSVSAVSGEDEAADIFVESDGRVVANGTGNAKVTVTSSVGGYSDSVIVSVYSSKVISISPTVTDALGEAVSMDSANENLSVQLQSGHYNFSVAVNPSTLSGSAVEWSTSDPDVLEINRVTGKAKAKLSGSATVSAVCADGVDGDISRTISVAVVRTETSSGITVNGLDMPTVLCMAGTDTAEILIDKAADGNSPIIIGDSDLLSHKLIPLGENQYRAVLHLANGHSDEVAVQVKSGLSGSVNTATLRFAEFAFNVYTSYHLGESNEMYIKNGDTVSFAACGEPSDSGITYDWRVSSSAISLGDGGDVNSLKAETVGECTLTVRAFRGDTQIDEVQKSITVVKPVSAVAFTDSGKTYGIENIPAFGDTYIRADGRYSPLRSSLSIRMRTAEGAVEYYSGSELNFSSSDDEIVSPYVTVDGLKAQVNGDGVASIIAKWQYADYFKENVQASLTLRGVTEGVSVSTYDELTKATEDGYKVVLNSDIMLGKANASIEYLTSHAKKMPTTYDWQFYANKGLPRPDVYYLVEFKNDVFGNGYTINGDYFTKAEDSTGLPKLFKGPLDFVAISSASVKAQDNIVFLVRTDGITIDNVVLKGCSDDSLINESGMDLSELNYTGTTLEIAADCRLLNSRVNNGRTVVRVFGGDTTNGNPVVSSYSDVDVEDERLNLTIDGCILTNAREFILKIGSNRAVLTNLSSPSPIRPTNIGGNQYSPFASSNASDSYFYDNYVITDVTLYDSVLSTSGLFSIGMDTHFAGEMLWGYGSTTVTNWKNLSATSFASALRLGGDVKLLDWKNLSNVDSSTLIESTGEKAFLSLDISAMLNKVYTSPSHPEYKNIVSVQDGEKLVHGGIACYGGGLNYSYVDFGAMTTERLGRYAVNLSVVAEGIEDTTDILWMQGNMLPMAAGTSDFVFYMYNSESNFSYAAQTAAIVNGSAYTVEVATV